LIEFFSEEISMRTYRLGLMTLGLSAVMLAVVSAQPPDGPPGKGGKGGAKAGQRGGPGGGVHLIPPFVRDSLNLTDDQQKQIADLEKEATDKLAKILTADQMKQLKDARPPRGPGGPGDGGPGGKGKGGPPGGGPPPGGPPPRDGDK
jgi:Spy/CpxP family protein refolding chaperone